MYDILFIDDKFEEIKDTFLTFKEKHVRCFYSDGESFIPQNEEKLLFKDLKYICLDFHLENRGITNGTPVKTSHSTLANIVRGFHSLDDIIIIINTAFKDDFNTTQFREYLEKDSVEIIVEAKNEGDEKFSKLHESEHCDRVVKNANEAILREKVIVEAIRIENLICGKILDRETVNVSKKKFSQKIDCYSEIYPNDVLKEELTKFRETRNKFAHEEDPNSSNLTVSDFLKTVDELTEKISTNN